MAQNERILRNIRDLSKTNTVERFLGSEMFRRRNKLRYTAKKAARLARIHPQQWHRFEIGEDVPSQWHASLITQALRCSLNDLQWEKAQ